MVLPDHDSASAYIQKYLEAVAVDSNKFLHGRKTSSDGVLPPPPPAHVQMSDVGDSGAFNATSEYFASKPPLPLYMGNQFNVEEKAEKPNYVDSPSHQMHSSLARSSSSSTENSHSSVSASGAYHFASGNVNDLYNQSHQTSVEETSQNDEPIIASPDVPSLEEKLIQSGHYQTPNSHSKRSRFDNEAPSSEMVDHANKSNGFFSPNEASHSDDEVNLYDVLNEETVNYSDDADFIRHSSDLESDEDGPTSYEVCILRYSFVGV